MRYVIIDNGVVVNIVVSTPEFAEEQGWLECPEGVGIGWTFDGDTPIPPAPQPESVHDSVDNAQVRLALIKSGISIATVDAAIAAIEDQVEREIAYTQWEYRATIRRDSELLVSLSSAIGLTSEQVDDLFRLAATL
jgi:hypothetical protein